ncbi:MAG TPA: AraC family transcriptional regulator [Longimicrobiaceae bacterium]|nr:AraC family transcriptional regulator [Longimicrobiaceae bacterium]
MREEAVLSEMTGEGRAKVRWRARWYLWDGGFLTLGRGDGVVPPHSHHAIQIVVGLDGVVGLQGPDGDWVRERGIMVAADVPHQFTPAGSLLGMIFVDPETREGHWLQRAFREPVMVLSEAKLERVVPALGALWEEPVDAPETARLIHSVVRELCVGPPPVYALDPRVLRALEVIRQMDTSRISLDDVARAVFLSPSRFAHLFSGEVGLPFRRYVLWRRLTRAMLAVGRGHTLSAAAHLCGFSDSAHLTRACVQMFGMPPSVMMQAGEFYEIPAPFELPLPAR